MRFFICVLTLCLLLSKPLPLLAQESTDKTSTLILQELKSISRKVDELKVQNRTLLENQGKIQEEIGNLKIRIRRN